MGCTPSMLLDHKHRHRDSTSSQEVALAKAPPPPVANKAVQAARAPRASLESDGFSIQLSSKKDSYVSQMGNNFATQLHIKRISGRRTPLPALPARPGSFLVRAGNERRAEPPSGQRTPARRSFPFILSAALAVAIRERQCASRGTFLAKELYLRLQSDVEDERRLVPYWPVDLHAGRSGLVPGAENFLG
ncbi:hypothetical protein EVAR_7945_1 [Eumeta japonica]|uniref:Uncharacterized protein n=1 Tax=Eumeta variegata TaxID=151549 RepID=A0A4C1THN6_EUMVA|nr:hypothetical protein EVAR_7945_1 [Eumeta japonica]